MALRPNLLVTVYANTLYLLIFMHLLNVDLNVRNRAYKPFLTPSVNSIDYI